MGVSMETAIKIEQLLIWGNPKVAPMTVEILGVGLC